MITINHDPFAIDPTYNWEESDKIVAATLSHETEQRLLELARTIRESLMAVPLTGTREQLDAIRAEQSYLRGKFDLLMFLVSESKEAKVTQHLI